MLVAQALISSAQAIAKGQDRLALGLIGILGSLDKLDLASKFALDLAEGGAFRVGVGGTGLGMGGALAKQAVVVHRV